jgi:hypothetical protein
MKSTQPPKPKKSKPGGRERAIRTAEKIDDPMPDKL